MENGLETCCLANVESHSNHTRIPTTLLRITATHCFLGSLLRARRRQVVGAAARVARALRRLRAAARDVARLATVVALGAARAGQRVGRRGALAADVAQAATVVAATRVAARARGTDGVLGARTRHVAYLATAVALLAALRRLRGLVGAVTREVLGAVAPEASLRQRLLRALGRDVALLVAVVAVVSTYDGAPTYQVGLPAVGHDAMLCPAAVSGVLVHVRRPQLNRKNNHTHEKKLRPISPPSSHFATPTCNSSSKTTSST